MGGYQSTKQNQQEPVQKENKPLTLAEKEEQATMDLMLEHQTNVDKIAEASCKGVTYPLIDNSQFEYKYERLELPKDEEGYVISFSPEDEEGYLEFFQKYGVVVVNSLLTEGECSRSVDQLWEFLGRISDNKILRDDAASWENWPALKKLGILGNQIILSPQFCENRQNPKIARVFEVLLGTDNLMVNVGRASAMRPTKGVKMPDGSTVDKPEWKTVEEWLHWDMCPWKGLTTSFSWKVKDLSLNRGYDKVKVQGVLSIVDCGENEGGFHCVPGFRHHIRAWANENIHLYNEKFIEAAGSIQVPKEDPIRKDIQKVPIRKGCLLVWDSCLPHGTFPNNSDRFRMIQYIKMADRSDPSVEPLFNIDLLPDDFQLTPLGRKLIAK